MKKRQLDDNMRADLEANKSHFEYRKSHPLIKKKQNVLKQKPWRTIF